MVLEEPITRETAGVWHNIWRLEGSPRDSLLLWLIAHDSMKTATLLWQRRAITDPGCNLCGELVEDTLHAVRDCRYTSQVWQLLRNHVSGDYFWELGDPAEWIHWNLSYRSPSCNESWSWKHIFRQVVQSIWRGATKYYSKAVSCPR